MNEAISSSAHSRVEEMESRQGGFVDVKVQHDKRENLIFESLRRVGKPSDVEHHIVRVIQPGFNSRHTGLTESHRICWLGAFEIGARKSAERVK